MTKLSRKCFSLNSSWEEEILQHENISALARLVQVKVLAAIVKHKSVKQV